MADAKDAKDGKEVVKILGIVGSLRAASYNRFALRAALKFLPKNATLTIYEDIGKLPLYNQDKEREPNEEVAKFKALIKSHDCVLFATPEFNFSVPGVLKNAIDCASRPYGEGAWQGKPVGIVSASMGPTGGLRAQMALRQTLVFFDCPVLNSPEMLIGLAQTKFDEQGNLKDEATQKHLTAYVQRLVDLTIMVHSKAKAVAA